MRNKEIDVDGHYGVENLEHRIFDALEKLGLDIECIRPQDLSAVDEFHIRGIESTKELAELANLETGMNLLDVGCGLGGSCRYLTSTFGVKSTGIDLTKAYCDLATKLSKMSGFNGNIDFHCCSATEMPFEDDSFDVVWTEHAQMNISDKPKFYNEMQRVLKPGGRLAFHDIFSSNPERILFPVPWADDESISFVFDKQEARNLIKSAGLIELAWKDVTEQSATWFQAMVNRIKSNGPPILGLHLLMGGSAVTKLSNLAQNLVESRIQVVQAVFEKR